MKYPSLNVDSKDAADLREFGIDTVYDRPPILQHTLQDFIFMKSKARYETGSEPIDPKTRRNAK